MRKAKLGSGKRFKALKNKVAKEYRKKGMSAKKAAKVGAAVAAKIGRKKYGAKKMAKLASRGRKRK